MIDEFKLQFAEYIPQPLEEGTIYISERFNVAIHRCACGCGEQTVMPIDITTGGWKMTKELDGSISFSPSIGNFNPPPYHAHYYIIKNKVSWCEPPTYVPAKQQ